MNRRRLKLSVLLACVLLILFAGAFGLQLQAQQRRYYLSRQLIAALVRGKNKQAIALVAECADPNTRFIPAPSPTLLQLIRNRDGDDHLLLSCGEMVE